MYLNSLHFAAFFVIVFGLIQVLGGRSRARNLLLLVASYYFYGCWDWHFLGLIVISTLVDYVCGRFLDVRQSDPDSSQLRTTRRRIILAVSLATNLGLLGFFKYYNFFVAGAAELLEGLGLGTNPTTLNIILPVGLSFYTFQTLSYTIDLYRGRIATEKSLLNFAVFVAFFPQLVAGPIERASNLLRQIRKPEPLTWVRFYTGFYLICWGLFKKVVIADQIAVVVDGAFGPSPPSSLDVLIGVYAFAIQIYCDFSGYTDIARGVARCLGIDLMLNFNLPYFAANPTDFWRRWHISLSSWLRDYLYIPLGGNRKGSRRTYINLLLTMVLGGLWHGAAWTFVLWGVYHGLLLCIHKASRPFLERVVRPERRMAQWLWFWLRVVVFFQLTCGGWLIFRAASGGQIADMLNALSGCDFVLRVVSIDDLLVFSACALFLVAVQLVQWVRLDLSFVLRLPVLVRATVYVVGFLGFIFFGSDGGEAFIYFQF